MKFTLFCESVTLLSIENIEINSIFYTKTTDKQKRHAKLYVQQPSKA